MAKHQLIINNLTLPYTKLISYGGEYVGKETVMASGLITYDEVGFRPTVTYTYDYLPAETMSALHRLLRANRVYNCRYLSPESNTSEYGQCIFDYPTADYFAYLNGKPVWHNAAITFRRAAVKT